MPIYNPAVDRISGENQFVVHINLIPASATGAGPSAASETGAAYVVKQRTYVDFDLFDLSDTTIKGKLDCRGFVPNLSSNGDIRVFNATDGVELGAINFTETTPTQKSVALSSIPTSGLKLIELQMRKNAGTGGGFDIGTAGLTFYAEQN